MPLATSATDPLAGMQTPSVQTSATDPVFSERTSPFQFAGPARFHPVPLPLEHWKNIDVDGAV